MKPVFYGVISAAVVGMMTVLMGAARRGVPTVDPATGLQLYRHHFLFRAFALFAAFGIPIGITALVVAHPPKNQNDFGAICFLYAMFAVLSAPLLWETTRFALLVGPEGIDARSPWRGRLSIPWDEVEKVSFSTLWSSFVVHAADGRMIRVPIYVSGINAFMGECEQRLSPDQLTGAKGGYRQIHRPFPEE